MRKTFMLVALCIVAWCVGCTDSLPDASIDIETYAPSAFPSSVLMTFASSADTRGFAWQTDVSVREGAVWIMKGVHGETDAELFEREAARFAGESSEVNDPILVCHKAFVSGLEPGAYSYRLGGEGRYVYGTFVVRRAENEFVAINLNDAQTQDALKLFLWENTVSCAIAAVGGTEKIDAVLYGGDLYDGRFLNAKSRVLDGFGKYIQWGMAVDTAMSLFSRVPWIMASGNHDWSICDDCTAVSRANKVPIGCQSLDYGNVHIAVLPFAGGKWNEKYEQIMDWLDADLAAAETSQRADWKVVSTHWGPYTTGDHGMSGETAKLVCRLATICSKRRVDLVLQAHDHTYSKTLPYRWTGLGWTMREGDEDAVNLRPQRSEGRDIDPEGTYYVSCGCAGHRVGENMKYASAKGRKSYRNRLYKVAIGRLTRNSKYGKQGDNASSDLGRQMFGVLKIGGGDLDYAFYVVETDGTVEIYDELKVRKTTIH